MEKTRFEKELKNEIESNLPTDYELGTKEVVKAEGTFTGIYCSKKSKGDDFTAAPLFYVENLYEQYNSGASIKEMAQYIIEKSVGTELDIIAGINSSFDFKNKEYALANVCEVLLGENATDLINGRNLIHTHLDNLGLYIIYEVRGTIDGADCAIKVDDNYLKSVGLTEGEIVLAAKNNTERTASKEFTPLWKVIGLPEMDNCELYFLGSEYYGAISLFYADLKSFADKHNCNLYLIPSSVHEWLVYLDRGNFTKEQLKSMVECVNSTEVKPEEQLSDYVFYYDRNAETFARLDD